MANDLFRTENEFVQWLQALVGSAHGHERVRSPRLKKGVKLGIGDDAALVAVKRGHELILTADMTIEDIHFSHRWHPAEAVGHRALARSLSDVAAMGGAPRYVLVSLALSKQVTRGWVSGFYRGMQTLARRFGVRLVGGDTALVPGRTFIDVLVAGEVPRGKALRRSGARAGDQIFVSGPLGLSALGLRLLQGKGAQPLLPVPKASALRRRAQARVPMPLAREAVHAHLYPEPQCALGRFLSGRATASALMDLSDGLSTDLSRLCAASGVGARLWAAKIPRPNLPQAADSLQLALHGGEDYQLLFTVPRAKVSRLSSEFQGRPLYHLGEIEASKGLRLVMPEGNVHALEPTGWDYFRSSLADPTRQARASRPLKALQDWHWAAHSG
jgi:thiamine-monophosphate kinase